MMTDRELVLKAQGIARTLTYNEEPQGAAKHIINELAHRLWDLTQPDGTRRHDIPASREAQP